MFNFIKIGIYKLEYITNSSMPCLNIVSVKSKTKIRQYIYLKIIIKTSLLISRTLKCNCHESIVTFKKLQYSERCNINLRYISDGTSNFEGSENFT